jgi:hypothetical protein
MMMVPVAVSRVILFMCPVVPVMVHAVLQQKLTIGHDISVTSL